MTTRTTISLPDPLAEHLKQEARRRRVSTSHVIRDALQQHLCLDDGGGERALPFESLGRSGHRDTARRADEVLAEGWADAIARDR